MDSVSQFVLGACIGHRVVPRGHARAMVLGGLIATIPDLDVLVRYSDAVDSFTYHRSWSHSLFVLAAISPFIAALVYQVTQREIGPKFIRALVLPPMGLSYKQCFILVFLCLITHPLLDACTIYGTQIYWPLPHDPVALGSIFIIDPLYTLPLIFALVWVWRRRLVNHSRLVAAALLFSTFYVAWTIMAQQHARQVATDALQAQGVDTKTLLVAPSPLSMLWRFVALDDDTYYEGYYSLLDRFSGTTQSVEFFPYDRGIEELDAASHIPAVKRLRWFTADFVGATVEDNVLVLSDLRMGLEGSYVFEFNVAEKHNDVWQPMLSTLKPLRMDAERMTLAAKRVIDPTINLAP